MSILEPIRDHNATHLYPAPPQGSASMHDSYPYQPQPELFETTTLRSLFLGTIVIELL